MSGFSAEQVALSDAVRREREARNWSQKKLAKLVGVSLGTIGNFENKHTYPQNNHLRDILRALEMPNPDEPAPAELPAAAKEPAALEPLGDCPMCGQVIWPRDFRAFFNLVGGVMHTMTNEEQEQFLDRATRDLLAIMSSK